MLNSTVVDRVTVMITRNEYGWLFIFFQQSLCQFFFCFIVRTVSSFIEGAGSTIRLDSGVLSAFNGRLLLARPYPPQHHFYKA